MKWAVLILALFAVSVPAFAQDMEMSPAEKAKPFELKFEEAAKEVDAAAVEIDAAVGKLRAALGVMRDSYADTLKAAIACRKWCEERHQALLAKYNKAIADLDAANKRVAALTARVNELNQQVAQLTKELGEERAENARLTKLVEQLRKVEAELKQAIRDWAAARSKLMEAEQALLQKVLD